MAYTPRRRRAAGGGGGSFITRLLGASAGDAASENAPINEATEPGQVPYQYKGDPSNVLGSKGYVTERGAFSSQPYSDVRSFWGRFAGQPNEAEALNLDLSAQRMGGDLEVGLKRKLADLEIEKAGVKKFVEATGLPPDLYDMFVPEIEKQQQALLSATTQEAGARGSKAKTEQMIEEETRTPRRRTAQQTAQRRVAEETRLTRAAMSGEGQQAIGGRYLAEQLKPIFDLRKAATIDVSPGELSQFSGQGLPDQLQKILGPGFTARGTTFGEQPILGQPIGQSGLRPFLGMGRSTQPGGIYPDLTPEEIQKFLGEQGGGAAAQPRATGEQFGPFLPSVPQIDLGRVGMPSMGTGGSLSAPIAPQQETPEQAMLRKQREAQQAQELLRRLLQQGTPYTPNIRNF